MDSGRRENVLSAWVDKKGIESGFIASVRDALHILYILLIKSNLYADNMQSLEENIQLKHYYDQYCMNGTTCLVTLIMFFSANQNAPSLFDKENSTIRL